MRAEVSRGRSSRWSNDHPGRAGKPAYRAKGQTDKELSRKEKGDGEDSRKLARPDRAWRVALKVREQAPGARGRYRIEWKEKALNTKSCGKPFSVGTTCTQRWNGCRAIKARRGWTA